jgi:hypothetical protein
MSRPPVIRSFADLIEHLEPDPYAFVGHYWSESQPEQRKNLEFQLRVHQRYAGSSCELGSQQFELRILFSGGFGKLATQHSCLFRGLGYINGDVLFVDRKVLFAARNTVASVFGHATFEDGPVISVAGTFQTTGERFLYVVKRSLSRGPASLANVQSIAKRPSLTQCNLTARC